MQSEDIKASMENGVLTIAFPRSTPEIEPKKITIA
jgi:HSP20 family protein